MEDATQHRTTAHDAGARWRWTGERRALRQALVGPPGVVVTSGASGLKRKFGDGHLETRLRGIKLMKQGIQGVEHGGQVGAVRPDVVSNPMEPFLGVALRVDTFGVPYGPGNL